VYPESLQFPLGRGLAVAAVGGDRTGRAARAPCDPGDRWCKLGSVRRVAGLDAVIQDDAVVVVDDLGFVSELDRAVDAALADRPGVGVVQG
jgi:hypothetical protein